MPLMSVFIHAPVSKSVNHALDAIRANKLVQVCVMRVDTRLVPMLLKSRPCVLIVSIFDWKSRQHVRTLVEEIKSYRVQQGEPPRDPSFRIVLISDEETFTPQSWQKLGIHEFIMGPILSKALAFKLERHYLKAFASEIPKPRQGGLESVQEAAGVVDSKVALRLKVEVPLYGGNQDKVIIYSAKKDNTSDRTMVRSKHPAEQEITKVVVEASHPSLEENAGEWEPVDDEEGVEQAWEWKEKITSRTYAQHVETANYGKALRFHGQQPRYDSQKKVWVFKGSDIALEYVTPDATQNAGLGGHVYKKKETVFRQTSDDEVEAHTESGFQLQVVKQQVYTLHESTPENKTPVNVNLDTSQASTIDNIAKKSHEKNYTVVSKDEEKPDYNKDTSQTKSPKSGAYNQLKIQSTAEGQSLEWKKHRAQEERKSPKEAITPVLESTDEEEKPTDDASDANKTSEGGKAKVKTGAPALVNDVPVDFDALSEKVAGAEGPSEENTDAEVQKKETLAKQEAHLRGKISKNPSLPPLNQLNQQTSSLPPVEISKKDLTQTQATPSAEQKAPLSNAGGVPPEIANLAKTIAGGNPHMKTTTDAPAFSGEKAGEKKTWGLQQEAPISDSLVHKNSGEKQEEKKYTQHDSKEAAGGPAWGMQDYDEQLKKIPVHIREAMQKEAALMKERQAEREKWEQALKENEAQATEESQKQALKSAQNMTQDDASPSPVQPPRDTVIVDEFLLKENKSGVFTKLWESLKKMFSGK